MSEEKVQRWVLAGTDYVYPRTTNQILEAYLKSKGVKHEDIMINYTPFGQSDWQNIVAVDQEVRLGRQEDRRGLDHQRRRQRAVLQGARQPGHQGDRHPGGRLLGRRGRAGRHRHQAAGRPSRRLELLRERRQPGNTAFIKDWHTFTKNPKRTTNDPMEAHYIGFNMWVKAVQKAGTTDPAKVIDAMIGVSVPNLTGGYSTMMPNHHITKPVLIGEIQEDGQFNVVRRPRA